MEETGIDGEVLRENLWFGREISYSKKWFLFGSRARGDFKRTSDIDLAVEGGEVESFANWKEKWKQDGFRLHIFFRRRRWYLICIWKVSRSFLNIRCLSCVSVKSIWFLIWWTTQWRIISFWKNGQMIGNYLNDDTLEVTAKLAVEKDRYVLSVRQGEENAFTLLFLARLKSAYSAFSIIG